MKSIEGLFPWIVIAVGIIFFNSGLWGIIGGVIMVISTMIYLYKNDRKTEFKIICSMLGVILVTGIIFIMLSYSFTPHANTITKILP